MLQYTFIPDEENECHYASVEMRWEGCDELTLDEHVERFRTFLMALTFTEKQAESVVIDSTMGELSSLD